jgi:hypothetical protein
MQLSCSENSGYQEFFSDSLQIVDNTMFIFGGGERI